VKAPSRTAKTPTTGPAASSSLGVLRGGEPTLQPVTHDVSAKLRAGHGDDRLRKKLPLRIVDELESDDPLLDSTVIQLPGADGARMTVVVHGSPDATPEQIQEALLAWRKTEAKLHRLPDNDDDGDEPRAANGL
jgi:hypothetical protein